jgi:hypothetical protein
MSEDIYDKAAKYGVKFTGELVGHEYHEQVSYDNQMTLAEVAAGGGRITRVRVLAQRWPSGYMCDISYIHATLADGTLAPVILGGDVFSGALWGNDGLKARMIGWAKEEGVFAKNLGLLDENNWSILYG